MYIRTFLFIYSDLLGLEDLDLDLGLRLGKMGIVIMHHKANNSDNLLFINVNVKYSILSCH